LDRAFRDLYDHSADIVQLERFLKARSKHPAKVAELIDVLALVDMMKSDISLLQDLIGLGLKGRKSASRLQTVSV